VNNTPVGQWLYENSGGTRFRFRPPAGPPFSVWPDQGHKKSPVNIDGPFSRSFHYSKRERAVYRGAFWADAETVGLAPTGGKLLDLQRCFPARHGLGVAWTGVENHPPRVARDDEIR
jgi:hypothetical protein